MKKAILAISLATLLYACDIFDTGKKYYIDNPSNKPLKVLLDGNITIELAPLEYKRIKIAPGNHQVVVDNGNAQSFTINEKDSQKGGMINPLGVQYVLWTEVYSDDARNFLPTQVISWNGEQVKGPFVADSATYIPNKWNYDVITPFPATIKVTERVDAAWQTKLFRAADFTREYQKKREK
jgi:hypothetical protein